MPDTAVVEALDSHLSNLSTKNSTVVLETNSALTLLLTFQPLDFKVDVVSWCCHDKLTWGTYLACASCGEYVLDQALSTTYSFDETKPEVFSLAMETICQAFFPPLQAVLFASELETAVSEFFTTLIS